MAKRLLAKHAKSKASIKKSKKASASASSDSGASSKKKLTKANKASQPTRPMPARPSLASATDVAANMPTEPMQQVSFDQTAQVNNALGNISETGFTSTADLLNKKSAKRHKTAKVLGITSLSLIAAIAAVYFAGVFVFSTHFMPNTHISDIDLTMKTAQDLQSDFEAMVGNYTFQVKGDGFDLEVSADDADVQVDAYAMAEELFSAQNAWAWPFEALYDHDETEKLTTFVSADNLSSLIDEEVALVNKSASDPVNAYCKFNDEENKYVVIAEQAGTKLDSDSVLQSVLLGVMSFEDLIVLDSSNLLQPTILSTDERLAKAAKKANEYVTTNLTINMDGNTVKTITGADVSKWIKITSKLKVKFNSDAMDEWVQELASSLNTVGSERTYKRPDGKKITVSGGDYGWEVDTEELVKLLKKKIKSGASEEIDVPLLQSGSGFSTSGKLSWDWGSRYIDVDISDQHAIFYGDDGKIIWESDIVSGLPTAERATPQGVYDVNDKGTNVTLIGTDSNGKETYRTPVNYWMPFKGNSVGLHDASWQPTFGGTRYKTGGSHGCINLPSSKAAELYDIIQVGDVVVVHS